MATVPLRLAVVAAVTVSVPAAARAAGASTKQEIASIAEQVRSDDRVTRAYGAIATHHLARRQWGFALFSRPELRDWQRALLPSVPALVEMLGDDAGMEWVDEDGNPGHVTTPRKEATVALLALERASVEPLIGALDRKELARKADQVLRQLTRGGPPEATRAAWQTWWQEHQGEPLPNERGQLWLLLLAVILLGLVVAVVTWRQRRARDRKSPLRAAWEAKPAPVAAPSSPAPQHEP